MLCTKSACPADESIGPSDNKWTNELNRKWENETINKSQWIVVHYLYIWFFCHSWCCIYCTQDKNRSGLGLYCLLICQNRRKRYKSKQYHVGCPKMVKIVQFTPIYNIGKVKMVYKYHKGVPIYGLWVDDPVYTLWSYVARYMIA